MYTNTPKVILSLQVMQVLSLVSDSLPVLLVHSFRLYRDYSSFGYSLVNDIELACD